MDTEVSETVQVCIILVCFDFILFRVVVYFFNLVCLMLVREEEEGK